LVLADKSIEEWIKIKGFKAWWGSLEWLVNPALSCFWMPLMTAFKKGLALSLYGTIFRSYIENEGGAAY